jgi:uncharacterized membrane protein
MESGIVTLISVAVNALAAVFAPFLARRMTRQQEKLAAAEETLEMVGSGLRVVEQAVEENKKTLTATGAGDKIARTIRSYGPAARALVDAARSAARELQESAVEAYAAERMNAE